MKRIIFALLCICLLAVTAAAFADGEGYTVKYYKNNCLAEVPEDDTVYQYGDAEEGCQAEGYLHRPVLPGSGSETVPASRLLAASAAASAAFGY